jgi:hypothetical protein
MPLAMWLSRLETANRSNAQSRPQLHALPALTRALVASPRALELAWPEGPRFLYPLSFGAMSPVGDTVAKSKIKRDQKFRES